MSKCEDFQKAELQVYKSLQIFLIVCDMFSKIPSKLKKNKNTEHALLC